MSQYVAHLIFPSPHLFSKSRTLLQQYKFLVLLSQGFPFGFTLFKTMQFKRHPSRCGNWYYGR